ncbi:MAG: SUMF1/EgtB/PvdO family nonheme iron enzyme [Planctomycetes bacterium]|nr:SUMF1/EgtB/PvdO family nonheme iron enzyme [Planctomycetota bacterium]
MTASSFSPEDPLTALARAWLAQDPERRPPLAELLAAHPAAAMQLTDALLDFELQRPAAAPPPDSVHTVPADGQRIGPYAIVRPVGRGGQATVFEAIDSRLGRRVALKVLRSDAFGSLAAEQRFRAEAATTSRLEHPGICPVYEIGAADDLLYLAMRFVAGETLAQTIQQANARAQGGDAFELFAGFATSSVPPEAIGGRRVRPWLGTLRLFESAALALHQAHAAGVAHRDIKPANIMVQPDGSAVLLDFGLAGDLGRDGASLTRTGDVFGTPAYMAPEQCRDARHADYRSDIFALGATLFEALTGHQAFDAPTAEGKIRRILAGQVPNPRRFVRGLPWEFVVVVAKALDPEPERRYASAAAFAEDLRRIREARPILARPPGFTLRAQRWLQRNPLLAALLVVTVGGIVTADRLWRSAAATSRDSELLAAPQRLAELRLQADQLRPVRAHREAAARWLEHTREFVAQRPVFERRLEELRQAADPATPAEVADLRRRHPATAQLTLLDETDASAEAGLGHAQTVADTLAGKAARDTQRRLLREQLATLRPYRFRDPRQQVLHDSIVVFLAALDEFTTVRSPLATVERELRELTAEVPTDWDVAVAAIAASPRYGGMQLRPQGGMSPLRCNPQSGLWEFLHVRSGVAPEYRADGTVIVAEGTGIVFALVPGGRYRIGSQTTDPSAPGYVPKLLYTEDYQVELQLDPYFLAVHEVSQAQWQRLGGGTPSTYFPGSVGPDDTSYGVTPVHPVESVSWSAAVDVLAQSGLELPTEAQWEVAARGGVPSGLWVGNDHSRFAVAENLLDAAAVRAEFAAANRTPLPWDDGFGAHAPVASLQPNPLGFHDMLGNVCEWCIDAEAWPNKWLMRHGDGRWLSSKGEKHTVRGVMFTMNLDRNPLIVRTFATGSDYSIGVRPARRVE